MNRLRGIFRRFNKGFFPDPKRDFPTFSRGFSRLFTRTVRKSPFFTKTLKPGMQAGLTPFSAFLIHPVSNTARPFHPRQTAEHDLPGRVPVFPSCPGIKRFTQTAIGAPAPFPLPGLSKRHKTDFFQRQTDTTPALAFRPFPKGACFLPRIPPFSALPHPGYPNERAEKRKKTGHSPFPSKRRGTPPKRPCRFPLSHSGQPAVSIVPVSPGGCTGFNKPAGTSQPFRPITFAIASFSPRTLASSTASIPSP